MPLTKAPDLASNSLVPLFSVAELLFNAFAPSVNCVMPLTKAPDLASNSLVPSFSVADLLFNAFAPSVNCAMPLTKSPDFDASSLVPSFNDVDLLFSAFAPSVNCPMPVVNVGSLPLSACAPASNCCTVDDTVVNWPSCFSVSCTTLLFDVTASTNWSLPLTLCWICVTLADIASVSSFILEIKAETWLLSCVALTACVTAACCSGDIWVSANTFCKLAFIVSSSAFFASWIFAVSSCKTLICCWMPATMSWPLWVW